MARRGRSGFRSLYEEEPGQFSRCLSRGPLTADLEATPAPTLVPAYPLFSYQWHPQNTGQTGGVPEVDINVNVVDVWD